MDDCTAVSSSCYSIGRYISNLLYLLSVSHQRPASLSNGQLTKVWAREAGWEWEEWICPLSTYRILWPCDKIAQNRVLWLLYKYPKFHFSTLELLTCDNYWPVTIFWPCPKVVIISDKYCINIGCLYTKLEVFVDKRVRGCARTERGNRFRVQVLLHVWLILQLLCRPIGNQN